VTTSWAGCGDDPDWRGIVDEPSVAGDDDFVLYRVAEDGASATPQSCATTEPDTCTDQSDGPIWSVFEHLLSLTPPVVFAEPDGTSCKLELAQTWTLDDQGGHGTWTAEVTFTLTGGDPGACEALEASIQAGSPNGLGMNGCLVRFIYTLVWFQAR
jgi:hypothetical protein